MDAIVRGKKKYQNYRLDLIEPHRLRIGSLVAVLIALFLLILLLGYKAGSKLDGAVEAVL